MMLRIVRMAARSGSRPAPRKPVPPPQRPRTVRQQRSDALGARVAAFTCMAVVIGLAVIIIVASLKH
jgi:hypothetical protein